MPRQRRSHIIRYLSKRTDYLVDDQYFTDLAAGSVNATLAEPGGLLGTAVQNTRNVVDTGNKLTITSSRVASSARTGASDPNIYYGPITREAGLSAKCTFCWVTNRAGTGWAPVNNTPIPYLGVESYAGQLTTSPPDTATYDILATGIDYTFWSTLFAAGGAIWVQGGAYASPTLIWLEDSLFTTPGNMYFYPITTNATDSNVQADNIKIKVIPGLATPAQIANVYVAIPVTTTVYSTSADSISMFKFALPGVPVAGDKIELRYRRMNATNYWTAYVIYNGVTSKWDFMVDEVLTAGTTNKITVADVGAATLRKIVVVVNGNKHYFWTEHTNYYERRGAVVTDADLVTETGVGAFFTAGTAVNLGSYPLTGTGLW